MKSTHYCLVALCMAGAQAAFGELPDWHQWRGPQRNGLVAQSPPLVEQLPAKGPKPLWLSEKIAGGGSGGWGSAVVADGRVYTYGNWKGIKPSPKRKFTDRSLVVLAWPAGMAEDMVQQVETARLSEERAALAPDKLNAWIGAWIKAHIPKAKGPQRQACYNRLRAGRKAVPAEHMKKVEAIKDKEFDSLQAMDTWLQDNVPDDKWRKAIARSAWKGEPVASDKVLCVDAATGKTIWRVELPGRHCTYACSSTPCVVGGRCYLMGSDANVYCFDAATGQQIWKIRSGASPKQTASSSIVVESGLAILLAGSLTGLDVDTGSVVWTQPKVKGTYGSAAYWRVGEKTYLVCTAGKETFCFDPRTGDVLWSVPGGGWSTPAIVGDYMAVFTNSKKTGLLAYKLAVDKPKQLWQVAIDDRGASALIHDGHVYAIGGLTKARAICIELESGKVAWEAKMPNTELASPVMADGKLWVAVGNSFLYVIQATPAEFTLLGKARLPLVNCASPALAAGKLYLRLRKSLACYDLRQPVQTGEAAPAKAPAAAGHKP